MMSMMSYKPRDIILVPFPFSDLSGEKQRPALVFALADKWNELACIMLTSSPKGHNEVPLKCWKQSMLPKATVARIHRIFTMERFYLLG
jgi:mRNA interferase MazF